MSKVVALFNCSRVGECRNDENSSETRIAGHMVSSLDPEGQ